LTTTEAASLDRHWPQNLYESIQYEAIDPSSWPTEIPVRVPLDSSLSAFTQGQNGKVTAWFNPSAIKWKGKNWMSFRLECFPFWKNGRMGVSQMTDDWKPIPGTSTMIALPGRNGYCMAEDGRFIVHRGKLLLGYNTGIRQKMAYMTDDLQIQKAFEFEPNGFELQTLEKNWAFFDYEGQLFCIYTQSPYSLMTVKDNVITPYKSTPWETPWRWGLPRGGATPVYHDGHLYHFFHSSLQLDPNVEHGRWKNPRRYHMGVVILEDKPPFRIADVSHQPIVSGYRHPEDKTLGWIDPSDHMVVFPGSAHRNDENDGWVVACGINDRHSYMLTIPDSEIIESCKP